jgi:hypothetical protein
MAKGIEIRCLLSFIKNLGYEHLIHRNMKTISEMKLDLKPIKDKAQYKEYLKIIDSLIDSEEVSSEDEVLELYQF